MPVKFGQPAFEQCLGLGVLATVLAQAVLEGGSKALPELQFQSDSAVVHRDGFFDLCGSQVWQVADVHLPTPADVVEVQGAGLALAAHHNEPAAAALAPDQALEVVVVAALAVAVAGHGFQDALDFVEELLINQRLVSALILGAAEVDVAEVVPVAQHGFDGVLGDRSGRVLAVRPRSEAGVIQLVAQFLVGVLAGGEQLVAELDERGPLGIDGHRVDLAALKLLGQVDVADRHPTRRTADQGFLRHLVAQVAATGSGLVTRDGEHDAEHHEALVGAKVDVLHGRDDAHAETAQFVDHGSGFWPVAVQPGHRIDHQERDGAVAAGALDELLVALALIGAGGADAGVGQLIEDGQVLLLSPAVALATLGRQAHALRVVLGLDLTTRGHPQVQQAGIAVAPLDAMTRGHSWLLTLPRCG